jgi:acid stress-induced BolA-like protein IbaG/YrbA
VLPLLLAILANLHRTNIKQAQESHEMFCIVCSIFAGVFDDFCKICALVAHELALRFESNEVHSLFWRSVCSHPLSIYIQHNDIHAIYSSVVGLVCLLSLLMCLFALSLLLCTFWESIRSPPNDVLMLCVLSLIK